MQTIRIYVTYKESVFDPQGNTITSAAQSLGHEEIDDVKVGKFFDVTLDTNTKPVEEAVKEVAEKLLVNFNLEKYEYQIL